MKAEDLRLNNWVNYKGKEYQVSAIQGDNTIRLWCDDSTHENASDGTIGCYYIKQITPIPLTEEWLVKFGFEKQMFEPCNTYSKNRILIDWRVVGNRFEEYFYKTEVKYVHQLQNLYFALTGEELTIK